MESGKIVKEKATVSSNGLMDQDMKDNGNKINLMVKVN